MSAIDLLRGHRDKYVGLLQRFSDGHAMDATRMDQALQRGDLTRARQLAHALYGAASTLGADAGAAAARQLEHADPETDAGRVSQQAALAGLRDGLAALAQALDDGSAEGARVAADAAA
jgi:HPt (histidine-containing phosphotransfer) domain-containing protein